MNRADLRSLLEYNRKRTLGTLDAIAQRPDAAAVLAWRPGPGRAHLAWQLMHIAATDDRHLNVRMKPGEPVNPDYVKRFESHRGSSMRMTFTTDPEVRLLNDDTAAVGYGVRSEMRVNGEDSTLEAVDTSTWLRKDGRWRCVVNPVRLQGRTDEDGTLEAWVASRTIRPAMPTARSGAPGTPCGWAR